MTQLKNNLVLFDKNSGEPIQQLWGSMERDENKHKMTEWPTIRMPFSSFKKLYPDGKVFINEIPRFQREPGHVIVGQAGSARNDALGGWSELGEK